MASSPPGRRSHRLALVAVAIAMLIAGCDRVRHVLERDESPHERYARSLSDAGLDSTALGREWLGAAASSIARATEVTLPFRETGYFAPSEARAVAWRTTLPQGRRLVMDIETRGGPVALFVDVFRLAGDSSREEIASARVGGDWRAADGATDTVPRAAPAPVARRIEVDDDEGGAVVVRVQPELLRGGEYTVTLRSEPTLAFPVSGHGDAAIRSGFGAARDAGARRHEGIDIFAPRGTPVVAATDGIISSTTPNRLGGTVVWLSDPRHGRSLYYAHLSSFIVRAGERVERGDTLGFVGNTGNARTTPPHLHFGIYTRGGAIDPIAFVRRGAVEPARLVADTSLVGGMVRVARADARIIPSPDRTRDGESIARETPLQVDGASGGAYRVRLPDGRDGWIAAALTVPASCVLARERIDAGTRLLDEPSSGAAVVVTVSAPRELAVLGRYAGFALVETPEGRTGWVAAD